MSAGYFTPDILSRNLSGGAGYFEGIFFPEKNFSLDITHTHWGRKKQRKKSTPDKE